MTREQIAFILDRFYFGWKINVLMFDCENHLVDIRMEWAKEIREKYFQSEPEGLTEYSKILYQQMEAKCRNTEYPVIHMEADGIYYMGFQDEERNLFLFGPMSVESLSFAQQIGFRKRHHITNQKYMVPRVPFAKAMNGLSMFVFMLTGRMWAEDEIMKLNHISDDLDASETIVYEINEQEAEKQHLAYRDEVQWTNNIERGTLDESVNRLTPENLERLEQIGTLANANSLKQYEYMAVTSTCLASRAAIRGGVNAYEAYMLSERFLQRISKCTNVMEILQVHMQISNEFSKQVRLARENSVVDCVEQCRDYIIQHRMKKFSLEDVAEAVGKNPSYLSRAFSERTGMTMQEFALELRLEAASNILRYADASIGEIAEYLHFSSQSYFGELFKKKYGVTPAVFRRQNKIRDFKKGKQNDKNKKILINSSTDL